MKSMCIEDQLSIWICAKCDLWWGCQPVTEPQTWRLFRLSNVLSTMPEELTTAPAWRVSGPDPSVCPECGSRMANRPTINRLTKHASIY